MVRRAARVDANQPEIVAAFRKMGATVEIHSQWPCGYDLLVHAYGLTMRTEVKDGSKPPSAQKLTENEQQAHDNNPATYAVVRNTDEAQGLLASMREHAELISRSRPCTQSR